MTNERSRILVVDDEPEILSLVADIFTPSGYEVTTVTAASEALMLVQTAAPDVILLDIGMPDMDGYTLIKTLRAMSEKDGGRTPAVALTAFARSEDRRQAMLAGFDVHVAKPVEPGELVAVVSRLASR